MWVYFRDEKEKFRFFLYCTPLVDIYRRPLLICCRLHCSRIIARESMCSKFVVVVCPRLAYFSGCDFLASHSWLMHLIFHLFPCERRGTLLLVCVLLMHHEAYWWYFLSSSYRQDCGDVCCFHAVLGKPDALFHRPCIGRISN